jgi:outer membrane receptor for ferrienterochelin and colicins
VRGSMSAHYTGRTPMQRDSDGTVAWREAYPRLDVRVARPVGDVAELSFNVENLLDERPARWAGLTQRQATLAFNWRLNGLR